MCQAWQILHYDGPAVTFLTHTFSHIWGIWWNRCDIFLAYTLHVQNDPNLYVEIFLNQMVVKIICATHQHWAFDSYCCHEAWPEKKVKRKMQNKVNRPEDFPFQDVVEEALSNMESNTIEKRRFGSSAWNKLPPSLLSRYSSRERKSNRLPPGVLFKTRQ